MRFIAAFILLSFLAWTQDQRATAPVEKILAVVGNDIILSSDVESQLELIVQQNPSLNRNDTEVRSRVLDALINEKLIVAKAIEDSIEILDDEVTQRMEMQVDMLARQFGSIERIEQLYGMSIAKIKRDYRDEIRKQMLAERIRQNRFGNVKATKADVEDFFQRYADTLPLVAPRIVLHHIVKYVKATDEQRGETIALALKVRDSILKGGSFLEFARRHSSDPGTAESGGELGWIKKGRLMPTYEAAAFELQSDEVSQPVETPFGIHIIQLIDKRNDQINTRHILFRIGQGEADKQRAVDALNDIRTRVNAGNDFEAIARVESDEKETQGFGGAMGDLELSDLPEDMRTALLALPDGGVSEPLPYAADPSKPGYHILYRKQLLPEHKPSPQTDYKMLERFASLEKRQRLEQEWVQELRRQLHWERRD